MSKEQGTRLSTAAQFFMEEDVVDDKSGSTNDLVVELLNSAALRTNDVAKITDLKKVQEYILHKDKNLLDNFLDEMLAFQRDKSNEVKKFVVGFIEGACKVDHEILPKIMANLRMMLCDDSVVIQKRVIQVSTQVYKITIKWLYEAKNITSIMESTWVYMDQIKKEIILMLDSDNDGIRTNCIKFMEALVLFQTVSDTNPPKAKSPDISILDIPSDFSLFTLEEMETEARQIFDSLVVFHGSPHISSVNLMTCMSCLCLIAKQRPELFMSKTVQALEALNVNLPPTLAKSQVSSVRKSLKMNLLGLLKNPSSIDYHDLITTLLTDLGASQQEVMKHFPKLNEIKRRAKSENQPFAKKMKIEVKDDKKIDSSNTTSTGNTAIDITACKLVPALYPENVVEVVMKSMHKLPTVMPPHFQATYTPIAAAGTEGQKKHLARLIATQLTAAGLGPGVAEIAKISEEKAKAAAKAAVEMEGKVQNTIQTVVGGQVAKNKPEDNAPVLMPSGLSNSKSKRLVMKQLDLKQLTQPLSRADLKTMTNSAIFRILKAESTASLEGVAKTRIKILSTLMTHYDEEVADLLLSFILEDLRGRLDLAISWLYEEYSVYHGFILSPLSGSQPSLDKYDRCFNKIIHGLIYKADIKDKEMLFSRLLLEAPCITKSAINIVTQFCETEVHVTLGLSTLKELVIRRPTVQKEFIDVVLLLTTHEKVQIRAMAIELVNQLHKREELQSPIEEHALKNLKHLLEPSPPLNVLNSSNQALKNNPIPGKWSEEIIKLFLNMFLMLLPENHKLIHDLATVYVTTAADIKRTILRILENPVKGMGMDSPELLLLVENCPKGAETLVTRIIHILTDKAPPSSALVARVRDLYHKRVPDVRFLIPVLNGLTKKEVIAALPKLLKLNPVVVKEVFNRLLCTHTDSTAWSSPLTPAELLIALHNIDLTKCDIKTIIKSTSLCFAEKSVYTQEVLAVVMQQLMEQNPLPTLFMRTVIQSLSLYPRLIGFIMNIMQRLIIKQVWKQKKVWEGFIKCCQRTQPQSFQVLLQLPPAQLEDVFETAPEIKLSLNKHVEGFTEHQKAHVPQVIMDVLKDDEEPAPPGHIDIVSNSEVLVPVPVKPSVSVPIVPEAPKEDMEKSNEDSLPPGVNKAEKPQLGIVRNETPPPEVDPPPPGMEESDPPPPGI